MHTIRIPISFLGTVLALALAANGATSAGGKHAHGHQHKDGAKHAEAPASAMHGQGHRHDKWLPVPEAYASRRGDKWENSSAIVRGAEIYAQYCQMCHGAEGKGDGPLAKNLSHPPADLTHHFHGGTRNPGDAYLFWRVSEGGAPEPFRASGSAMPAFKGSLSVSERWEVLAFVHNSMHRGLPLPELGDHAHAPGDHASENPSIAGSGRAHGQ